MRTSRLAPILAGLAIPILGSGCIGYATEAEWPAGIEAIISTRNLEVLAYVPIDQQENAGSREWVPIPNGTRVVSVDGLHEVSSATRSSAEGSLAEYVRVKPLTGEYSGLELIVLRGELTVPPPEPDAYRLFMLLPVAWVLASMCPGLVRVMCRPRHQALA